MKMAKKNSDLKEQKFIFSVMINIFLLYSCVSGINFWVFIIHFDFYITFHNTFVFFSRLLFAGSEFLFLDYSTACFPILRYWI